MKIAGIRQLRAKAAALLGGSEPILVTRHGRLSGIYIPLEHPDEIPQDLRRELASVLGRHLAAVLENQGVGEDELLEDFDAHRRDRR
jgi:hypothetical protein